MQAEKIRSWRPWQSSTGPKTDEGKQTASMNARKHGGYSAEMIALRRMLREHDKMLKWMIQ